MMKLTHIAVVPPPVDAKLRAFRLGGRKKN